MGGICGRNNVHAAEGMSTGEGKRRYEAAQLAMKQKEADAFQAKYGFANKVAIQGQQPPMGMQQPMMGMQQPMMGMQQPEKVTDQPQEVQEVEGVQVLEAQPQEVTEEPQPEF